MLGVVSEREEIHQLAEFGVVFLMFSIGLEFSLSKLKSMRRLVFGLDLRRSAPRRCLRSAQRLPSPWQIGLALGGHRRDVLDRIVSKLLAERGELDSSHGRQVIAVLLSRISPSFRCSC